MLDAVEEASGQDPGPTGHPARGGLHVFLGTAIGVGKTYAMLNEGMRRSQGGEDVVIGYWEQHDRVETGAQQRDLEIVPPRLVTYRGATFEDLDVDAVIACRPDVALVDELAHTSVVDGRSRWMDVEDLRRAGIDVVSTLNVANVRSVRGYASEIIGAGSVDTVEDEVLGDAAIELVDVPPEVLRQRVAAGYVYSADRVGGALANYFRAENLAALSELGRSWLAGTLEEDGPAIVARYTDSPPRPLVIAGVSGADGWDAVIRRAAGLAEVGDADLSVVRVVDGVGGGARPAADSRDLARSLGATYTEVKSEDVAEGLVIAAADQDPSAFVVGRHRWRWVELLRGSVARSLRRRFPGVTVEEVLHGRVEPPGRSSS